MISLINKFFAISKNLEDKLSSFKSLKKIYTDHAKEY